MIRTGLCLALLLAPAMTLGFDDYPELMPATNVEPEGLPSASDLEGDYQTEEQEAPEAPQASNYEPTPVALPAAMETGDGRAVRRFVNRQLGIAEEAAEKKKWREVSEKVAMLEELVNDQAKLEKRLRDLQDQLTAMAALASRRGDVLAAEGEWVGATESWKKALAYRPGFRPAKNSLRKHQASIAKEAKALHAAGIQRYVEGDMDAAIEIWLKVKTLDPSNSTIDRDIEKARRMKKARQ